MTQHHEDGAAAQVLCPRPCSQRATVWQRHRHLGACQSCRLSGRPRTSASEPSFNKLCEQFLRTLTPLPPPLTPAPPARGQRPQTGLSFTGAAALPRVWLPYSAPFPSPSRSPPSPCVTRLLSPVASRDKLSSQIVFNTRFPALVPCPCAWTSCHLSPCDIQAPFPPVRL